MKKIHELSQKILAHIKNGDAQQDHIIENFQYEKIHQQIIESHARDRDKPKKHI